jgi:hypothetical protein
MKLKQLSFARIRRMQAFTPVLVVGLLMVTGAVIYNFNAHAATAGFYFTSSADSYDVGDTFTVGVYENSGTDCANVVEADISYPANLLQYNSSSASGSNFDTTAPAKSTSGSISLVQFTTRKQCGSGSTATSGVSGNQLIGTVSFTVLGSGNAPINFEGSSIAVSSTDNTTNVAANSSGKSFSLVTAVTPTPTPTPSPSPQPTPAPAPTPTSTSTSTSTSSSTPATSSTFSSSSDTPDTSITPDGTDSSIAADNNETVQVTTPVDVQPLPIQPNGVSKIEYYLNGKLMATVTTAPYTYHLNTTNLLNGSYTLTTKTFYSNGQTKSVSQTLAVKNAFGFTQFKLELQKYAWLVVMLILLLIAGVIAWFVHKRGGGSDTYYDDGTYEMDGAAPITPTTVSPQDPNLGPTPFQPPQPGVVLPPVNPPQA